MGKYSQLTGVDLEEALSQCRGSYQRNLVLGYQALSGATLRGNAKNYSARYKDSANNLMRRLRAKGVAVERIGDHNRREIHPASK